MSALRCGLRLFLATLLAGAACASETSSPSSGANFPEARFRGAPTYDFSVTNVRWEAATPEYSHVTFDLYWSHSWRAKWTEPAATSCTGKDQELESWDAAWVFVKFLPEKDTPQAQERNHWLHATLDKSSANHTMPAGATNSVKLSDDNSRGMGVFIYRDAVGWGTNDWKNIRLRWNHGTDKIDPAKAAVRVFPIAMVYVPQGPFKIGTGGASGISKFPDGPTLPSAAMDHVPGGKDIGSLTDGAWRGGPVVPFLADAEWNRPTAESSRARRIGARAGELWSTLTYVEGGVGMSYIGNPGVLGDEYPTGYDSFYCMKYDVTQGQYVDYLNSLPPDVAAGRSCLGTEVRADYPLPGLADRAGLTITVSTSPGADGKDEADSSGKTADPGLRPSLMDMDDMIEAAERAPVQRKSEAAGLTPPATAKRPPVYSARLPFRSCSGISRSDYYAYAIWTAMRPMTELEFEKARRGVRNPVPHEYSNGTTNGVRTDVSKDMVDLEQPTERFRRGNHVGGYGDPLTVFRVGCFATPTSDRVAANATYWGILELGGYVVSALRHDFRGTHGDGTAPAGKPDAPLKRHNMPCEGLDDWPKRVGSRGNRDTNDRLWVNNEYMDGRYAWNRARFVISAANTVKKPLPKTKSENEQSADVAPTPSKVSAVAGARQTPSIRVSNVKWEPGTKDYSTISFDLAWEDSWRAKWDEPSEKNVTGRPLSVESRDAAWVFLKFRPAGTNTFWHGMLSANAADHRIPAGAALDVGLSDGGKNGVGVFVYRDAIGNGANDFKGIKLRWVHPPAPAVEAGQTASAPSAPAPRPPLEHEPVPENPSLSLHGEAMDEPLPVDRKTPAGKASAAKRPATSSLASMPVPPFEPGKAQVKVHALEMVYVPQGAFQSRVPWDDKLTTIRSATATDEWGCRDMENRPANADYPNGYNAFYCTKYAISQGDYTDYLNALGSRRDGSECDPRMHGLNRFTIQCDTNTGIFKADVPWWPCNFLDWSKILKYEAWAGLRPPTDLEYEKACRGPRAVTRREDAWTEGVCGPATGLSRKLLPALPGIDAGASYWGIRGLSLSGCFQEWPGIIDAKSGNQYRGNHGDGSSTLPPDWPDKPAVGRHNSKSYGYTLGTGWVTPENVIAMGDHPYSDKSGRYGAHPVRTAPVDHEEISTLQLDPMPSLRGYDAGIFQLSGRFRNLANGPVKVEIVLPFPETCFIEGSAARMFTAAPGTETPFRALVAVMATDAAKSVQGDDVLYVQIRKTGGELLAQQAGKLAVDKTAAKPSSISANDGGTIEARLLNASDRPMTVSVVLDPSPEFKPAETERRVEIAAGKDAVVTYPVPRQPLRTDGLRQLPFRMKVGPGAMQSGHITVNVLNQSRWWLGRKVTGRPGDASGSAGRPAATPPAASSGNEDKGPDGLPDGFFTMEECPRRWNVVEAGSMRVPFTEDGSLPTRGSSVMAGTKVMASVAREVKIAPTPGEVGSDILRIWVNEAVVYDSRLAGKSEGKPFALRAGTNTLAVSWCSGKDGTNSATDVTLNVTDAKTGTAVTDLVLNIGGE